MVQHSAISEGSWFHKGMVFTKKELLYADVLAWMYFSLWLERVSRSAGVRMSDVGTSTSLWMVLKRVISLMSLRRSAGLCQPSSAIISDTLLTPGKHKTLSQCLVNVGPASQTVAQCHVSAGIGVVIDDESSCAMLDHLYGWDVIAQACYVWVQYYGTIIK